MTVTATERRMYVAQDGRLSVQMQDAASTEPNTVTREWAASLNDPTLDFAIAQAERKVAILAPQLDHVRAQLVALRAEQTRRQQ